ncbi:hypothetical protein SLEP1_g20387 [Rubroshorea leprosula]|uniref:Uncharacterized protein n=1 Tax=Rubroshorea leprosula TaxID=152421 RepID=A0AAV5JA46_9ROSI|nr:hypothetical protein SLEP1_g20387 [Rubroshorea leprosula]
MASRLQGFSKPCNFSKGCGLCRVALRVEPEGTREAGFTVQRNLQLLAFEKIAGRCHLVPPCPSGQESHFGVSPHMRSWQESNLVNLVHINSRSVRQLAKERDAVGKASYGRRGKPDFQANKRALVPLMSFDNMGLKRIDKDGNMIGSIRRQLRGIQRQLGGLVLVRRRPIPLLVVLL